MKKILLTFFTFCFCINLIFGADLENPANFLNKKNLVNFLKDKDYQDLESQEKPLLEKNNQKSAEESANSFYQAHLKHKKILSLKKFAWHCNNTVVALSCVGGCYYALKSLGFSVGDFGGAYVMYGTLAPSWLIAKNVASCLWSKNDNSLIEIEEKSVKNFVRFFDYPQIQKAIVDNLNVVLQAKKDDAYQVSLSKLRYINSIPINYQSLEEVKKDFKSNFSNCDKELNAIVNNIDDYTDRQYALVISGKSGIGKTFSIIQFAKHYGLPLVKPDLTNPYGLFGDEKHAGSLLDALNELPEHQKGIFPFAVYLEDPDKIIDKNLNKQILQLIDGNFYSAFLQANITLKSIVLITVNNKENLLQDGAMQNRCNVIDVEGENYRKTKKQ